MILSEGLMRTVFLIYGVFWVVVLIVLFFGIGALIKRAEQHGTHSSH